MSTKYKYYYKGPVRLFDFVVEDDYEASTVAVSEKQAINNLAYQYKKARGYYPNTSYTLYPCYLTRGKEVGGYEYFDKEMKKMIEEVENGRE